MRIFGKLSLGIVAAVTALALMAPTGGFPSRPTFQQVTISGTTATPLTRSANITGADTLALSNTSTVSGDTERISISAGTSNLQLGVCNQNQSTLCKMTAGPTTASAFIETFGTIPLCFGVANTVFECFNGTNGGISVGSAQPASQGDGTINAAGGFYQNGVKIPRVTACGVIGASGAISSILQNMNCASSTHPSAGSYTVSFTTAYATLAPVCTAAPIGTLVQATSVTLPNSTTSTVQVSTTSTSTGASADATFQIICVGT